MRPKAAISTVLGVLFAVAAQPALARAEASLESGAPAIDGGVTAREPEWALRLSLAPSARLQPYLGVGRQPAEIAWSAVPHRFTTSELDSGSIDVGTGLRWKLEPRVELFGEYDMLSMRNPVDQGEPGPGLVERPAVRGGLSIRF